VRILIADDDPVTLEILGAILARAGHEVLAVENGLDAWYQLEQTPIPLLVTDWNMPDVDGLELCRRIRERNDPLYTYIILLTGVDREQGFLAAMDAGADDFVSKPFKREELLARVRVAERVLGLQADVRELQGLLPICSYCKSIRDDQRYWHTVDDYIARKSQLKFSHGICPACWEKHVEPQIKALEERARLRQSQE